MFNPRRLELARKRRRYTATILADRAQIAPVTLSRIVNGKQTPDEETVKKLATALDYPREFFFGPEIDPIDASAASFRSLKAMTAREREAATSAGMLSYLVSDWVKSEFDLPPADLLDLSTEPDPEAAARTIRQHWAIGEKPIGHMVRLLETKGIRVFSLAENTRNVDAFSCWRNGEPYIFINTFKTTERSRYDSAHELGHLVLHKHGGPKQGSSAEFEANMFASSFLMPSADVAATIPYVTSLKEIIAAKKRWGVSAAALAYRLHKMKKISDWQYRMFCIQLNRSYNNSEPDSLPAERSSVWKMVLSELWKDGVSRNHIAAQLALPQDEMENLLFGLIGEMQPPNRPARPALRVVN
jgi:Zn-dependent peptidase ImmA (M78 family)